MIDIYLLDIVADYMTKPLIGIKFQKFRNTVERLFVTDGLIWSSTVIVTRATVLFHS